MSYLLSKDMEFEASHQLMHHDGKCAQLHGHTWRVRVTFCGLVLQEDGPKRGMLIDFGLVGTILDGLHMQLDHQHLNEVLATDTPTSEFVARWIYNAIDSLTPPEVADRLYSVEVSETHNSRVVYSASMLT